MRVLMVSTGEKGHLNPMMGVAQHLRRGGHEVAWLCVPEPVEQLARAGIPAIPLPGDAVVPPHVTGGEALARLVRDEAALGAWIERLLLDPVEGQIEPFRRAYRAWRPDRVALDPMLYQAVIAAHLEGIPYAGISSSLNPVTEEADVALVRTVRRLSPRRAALFARFGLQPTFKVCDCLSPWVNTVFATEAYVGDAVVPERTWLVGPSLTPEDRGDEPDDFPWDRLDGRPVVYASFGSQISWQPDLFRLVAAAVPPDAQLVVTAGDLADTAFADDLDAVVVRYAPQRELLRRVAVFVTHGGANSVMEALTAGVPLLMSPVCNDQHLQARFLGRSGAGRVLDLHGARVEDVHAAFTALLRPDAPERAAVERIAASYRARDGAAEAARRIVETPV